MTEAEAREWLAALGEDEEVEQEEVEDAFEALYGRKPDGEDRKVGVLSLAYAAL